MSRFRHRNAIAAGLVAASACGAVWADAVTDSGMSADQLKTSFVESLGSGQPNLPSSLRKLGGEARVDFVRAAGTVLIAYSKTSDFRDRYAAWRTEHAPHFSEFTAAEMTEKNEHAQADYRKSQQDQNDAIPKFEAQREQLKKAGLTDAQLDQMEAQMKQAFAQLKDMQTKGALPSGPGQMTEEQRQQENAARKSRYDAEMADFDRAHPAGSSELVRAQLQQFLDISASVDFDAKVESGRFADPANEKRPDNWKRCFRAGKPAIEAARAVAQEWLKSL